MSFTSFAEAEVYLYQFTNLGKQSFTPQFTLDRAVYLLQVLDNPQNKLKVIHIAGTSGKGSTCTYISQLLQAHGFKVGLTVSPHMIDIRERVQLNNESISKKLFMHYLAEIQPAIEQMKSTEFGAPSYFEIIIALAYWTFWKENVDYAVIETGMGGIYDATNTVDRADKVAVITRIGLDHTEFLGNTLLAIAEQKAGIIQPGNLTIIADQEAEVKTYLTEYAHKKGNEFYAVDNISIKEQQGDNSHLFDLQLPQQQFHNLIVTDAAYQVENAAVAAAVLAHLAQRDRFELIEAIVKTVLQKTRVIGRFEIIKQSDKTIVLDGAHNPQKMQTFLISLKTRFPPVTPAFIIAFKKGKDYKQMLDLIRTQAQQIIVTEFENNDQGMVIEPQPAQDIVDYLQAQQYDSVLIERDLNRALSKAQEISKVIVITGSLYLISAYEKVLK
ncbi:MAG: folylpolyglutamate synthase/dihydrofolate synthase family protein [Weeksellaceae bacterium]